MRSEVGSNEMIVIDRVSNKLDMNVVGMYGLGLFVLQAVCAVLIFGSKVANDGEDEEFKIVGGEEQRTVAADDVRIRRIVAEASKVVNVDEAVLEERIEEIRAMARNAREREADGRGNGKSDVEVDGTEKEVSSRLVRLQKKLGPVKDKPLASIVNSLSKVEKDSGSSEEVNGKLVFPKKQTFRNSIAAKPMNDVKGFSNATGRRGSFADKQQAEIGQSYTLDGNSSINEASTFDKNVEKRLLRKKAQELKRSIANMKTDATSTETKAGDVQGISNGMQAGTSKTSTSVGASHQQNVIHDKNNVLSVNSSSNNRETQPTVGRTGKGKGSGNEVFAWWLRLPCVFGILMREGSGPEGMYTLKATGNALEKKDEAYTVVFEDRGDANNFCYIVESFFEETTDFTADVIPVPTKELREPVELGVLNVVVVKKGQLGLYAGQPLGEVETRIRVLVL